VRTAGIRSRSKWQAGFQALLIKREEGGEIKVKCECGNIVEKEDSTPVQMSGWYGNYYFNWGQYNGVHQPMVTMFDCPKCGRRNIVNIEEDY
jgi:hypothetical protein